jgi:hypothetical protein
MQACGQYGLFYNKKYLLYGFPAKGFTRCSLHEKVGLFLTTIGTGTYYDLFVMSKPGFLRFL